MGNKNDRDIRVENAINELLEEANRIFSKYNLTNWGAFEACAEVLTLMIAFNLKECLTPEGLKRRDEVLAEILSAMKADIIKNLKDTQTETA
jgi:hypothetical protein